MRISDWSSDVCSSDLRQKAMATSGKQITAITKGRLISLRADFPVNPSATRGSGEETGTIATSGLGCLEQFAKYVPDGSLRKMFEELLIAMRGWSSESCKLNRKRSWEERRLGKEGSG